MLCYRHDGQTTPSIIAPISLQGCAGEAARQGQSCPAASAEHMQPYPYLLKNKSFHCSICSRHRLTVQPRTHFHPECMRDKSPVHGWCPCAGDIVKEGSKMKVTIQECIEKYNTEHLAAVIAAGQVVGFVQEG